MYFKITFDLDIFIIYQDIGLGKRRQRNKAADGFIFSQWEKGGLVYISNNLNIKLVIAC